MMQRVRWVYSSTHARTRTHAHKYTQQAHTAMVELQALVFLSLTHKHPKRQNVSVRLTQLSLWYACVHVRLHVSPLQGMRTS